MNRSSLIVALALVSALSVAPHRVDAAEPDAPGARATVSVEAPLDGVVLPASLKVAETSIESMQGLIPNRLTPDDPPKMAPPPEGDLGGPVIPASEEPGKESIAANPLLDVKFEGPYDRGAAPTDAVMAVGRDHVVALVNRRIAVFSKPAGTVTSGPFDLATFFGIAAGFNSFDPVALYDPFMDRFIVAAAADNAAANDSRLYLAFSQSNDPNGPWNKYFIDADAGQPNFWADYPSNGIDRLAVYYTANMFGRASGNNVTVFIYDKQDGYAGRPLTGKHLIDVRDDQGNRPFRLRPAYVQEVVPGDAYYFTQTDVGLGNTARVFRLTGDRFTNPVLTGYVVPLAGLYFGPGSARQPGTSGSGGVDTLGGSVFNAWYRRGSVWTAHAIGSNPITTWVHKLDVTVTPPVRRRTYQVSAPNLDTYFPHVIPDLEDDDFALFSAVSGSDVYVTGRYWNVGADGTVRATDQMATGTKRNDSSRHGDYFAVARDPRDPNRVWGIAQYMANSDFAGNTAIASARFEDVPAPVAPVPVPPGSVRVAKAAGGGVRVSWDATQCAAPNHDLVWFNLAEMKTYAVAAETCAVGSTGSWTGAPPAGNVGVLVVGTDGAQTEGTHGTDSDGVERPSAAQQCGITQKVWFGTCNP